MYCPDCDGVGYIVVEWSTENEHGQDTQKCDMCDGTGEVLLDTTEMRTVEKKQKKSGQ